MKKKSGIINHKRICSILFLAILFFSLTRIIFTFTYEKEGLHSDEVWSFGLSNSYYEPFIFKSADQTVITNKDQWISGETMHNYLTVNENQRFSYDSVIYNQNNDYHPPLYYLILHTICSFFCDKVSVWYAFVINIIAYIITIIYLYKLVNEVTKSDVVGLICCAFFGFSIGTLNNYVYLRMYALLTGLAVILLYIHAQIYYKKNIKAYIVPLIFISILGFLTHHFFLPYAAIISCCFCIYFLVKKEYKNMIIYAGIMISSVVISLILFPATISHLLSDRTEDPKFTMNWQIALAHNCVSREIFGIEIPFLLDFSPVAVLIVIVCIIAIFSPSVYLIRNTDWFRAFIQNIKKVFVFLVKKIKNADLMLVTMFVTYTGIILITAFTVSAMLMAETMDRYMFLIYPAVCVFFVSFIYILLRWLVRKDDKIINWILLAICSIFLILSNISSDCIYLFRKPDDSVSIKSIISDSNCIYITDEYWLCTCFAWEAIDSNYFYATSDDDLVNKLNNMPVVPDDTKQMYFVVADNAFRVDIQNEKYEGQMPPRGISKDNSYKLNQEEIEDLLYSVYSKCEYIGHDFMFDREYHIYCVK